MTISPKLINGGRRGKECWRHRPEVSGSQTDLLTHWYKGRAGIIPFRYSPWRERDVARRMRHGSPAMQENYWYRTPPGPLRKLIWTQDLSPWSPVAIPLRDPCRTPVFSLSKYFHSHRQSMQPADPTPSFNRPKPNNMLAPVQRSRRQPKIGRRALPRFRPITPPMVILQAARDNHPGAPVACTCRAPFQ